MGAAPKVKKILRFVGCCLLRTVGELYSINRTSEPRLIIVISVKKKKNDNDDETDDDVKIPL